MRIQRLKTKHHDRAAQVFWVLFPFLGFWLLWKLFQYMLGHHQFYTLKAKKQPRKILGIAAFTSLLLFGRKLFFLQYLVFDKDVQGKGHGTETIQKLETKARNKKHDFFFLMSPPWRPRAQQFYLKNGFTRLLWFLFWKRLK